MKGGLPPEDPGGRRSDGRGWQDKYSHCQLPSEAANLSVFLHQTLNDPHTLPASVTAGRKSLNPLYNKTKSPRFPFLCHDCFHAVITVLMVV